LFPGKKRMAFGAHFHPDLFLRRSGLKSLTAGTYRRGLIIRWMNIFLQGFSPLSEK